MLYATGFFAPDPFLCLVAGSRTILVMSEAVMMGLGPYIGREVAHDLVYDLCRDALKQQRPLLDLLCENAEISRHLDREALAKLCDPVNYLGQSSLMVDRVLARMPV